MKDKLRKQFLLQRNNLLDKNIKDDIIRNKFLNSQIYKQCKSIFTYVSMGSEVDTIKVIESAISDSKIIAVPKTTENNKMIFVKINSLNELEAGKFNILEPVLNDEIISDEFTIFLVPALAFDKNNYRLGYGGGYYDRYLANIKCLKKIGLAYNFQIVDNVPHNNFDISVDFVITD